MSKKANWANRTIFHGDNIGFLGNMNSQSVDLIATDPPFNKGLDFNTFPDKLNKGASFHNRWSWDADTIPEWLDTLEDDFPEVMHIIRGVEKSYGSDLAAYLSYMGVRIIEMHRILKNTGSFYLHCDPTASHYLKSLLDAIFGKHNFRNEIIWSYRTGGASNNLFAKKHDVILFYSKTGEYTFNLQKEKAYTKAKNRQAGTTNYGGGETEFFEDEKGVYNWVNMRDVWDISYIGSKSPERIPDCMTQKPLELYERIIATSSKKGDIVLDPFCGCATTLVAAEKLKRQWVGIDLWDKAYEVNVNRLKQEKLLRSEIESNVKGRSKFPLKTDLKSIKRKPKRTDDGLSRPKLKTPNVRIIKEPPGPPMTRAQMLEILLEELGPVCQGCGREFDDNRYLQLDHMTPRSQGGVNNIVNRTLLCSPCNIVKSDKLTIKGLINENKKKGYRYFGEK